MNRGALLAAVLAAAACDGEPEPQRPAAAQGAPAPSAERALPAPPVFEECAEESGLRFRMAFIPTEQGENFKVNVYDHGSGVAVGDADGDGDDDVYLCTQIGPNALFRNDGGKFTDVTASAGAGLALADRIKVSATFADADGDGDQDLYVTSTRGGNVFFRNLGGMRFEDATKGAGLELVAHSQTACFFDADRDGDLDLYVANTARWTDDGFDARLRYYPGPATLFENQFKPAEKNVFYRNRGDGTFEDATEAAGLGAYGWCCDVALLDYDEDGALDVFVTSMFGKSVLFRNDGEGRFEDQTLAVFGRVPYGAMGARAFDSDGDGRIDVLVADMHSDMWSPPDLDTSVVEPARKYPMPYGPMYTLKKLSAKAADDIAQQVFANKSNPILGNALYRALGDGRFEEVSDRCGAETFQPWGVVVADFRNAGAQDVYVPSGMGYPFFVWPDAYLLNRGDGTFVECAAKAGFEPRPGGPWLEEGIGGERAARSARAGATSDFDGDGRVDLVVNNFNDRAHLFMNRSTPKGWIAFRLRGAGGNRDAIGALVTVRAGGRALVRQVAPLGGYLACSSKTVHVGLGDARPESVEVRWPSGKRTTLDRPEPGRVHDVAEEGP